MKLKRGFTLAEVLITLAIIGVVAALTIPVVVRNYQKTQTVVKLKKVYTTLANTTNLIISQEGAVKNWATSVNNIYGLYRSKLKLIRDCGSAEGCIEGSPYKYLSGGQTTDWDTRTDMRKVILADGTQMTMEIVDASCSTNNFVTNGSNNICAAFLVDLNGLKAPNQIGRDIFEFVLKEKGVEPAGCDIDNICNKNNTGYSCACKVIRENTINYY